MKKETTPKDDPRGVLAALDARVKELGARAAAPLKEQLALEAAKIAPLAPNPVPVSGRIDVAKSLDADAIESTNDGSEGARLYSIIREREVIAAAVRLAAQRGFRLRVANEAQLAGDIHDRAHKNIAKVLQAVRLLRDLAGDRR